MTKEELKQDVEKYAYEMGYDFYEKEACIDGALFGYNKATEWHYVKDEVRKK